MTPTPLRCRKNQSKYHQIRFNGMNRINIVGSALAIPDNRASAPPRDEKYGQAEKAHHKQGGQHR